MALKVLRTCGIPNLILQLKKWPLSPRNFEGVAIKLSEGSTILDILISESLPQIVTPRGNNTEKLTVILEVPTVTRQMVIANMDKSFTQYVIERDHREGHFNRKAIQSLDQAARRQQLRDAIGKSKNSDLINLLTKTEATINNEVGWAEKLKRNVEGAFNQLLVLFEELYAEFLDYTPKNERTAAARELQNMKMTKSKGTPGERLLNFISDVKSKINRGMQLNIPFLIGAKKMFDIGMEHPVVDLFKDTIREQDPGLHVNLHVLSPFTWKIKTLDEYFSFLEDGAKGHMEEEGKPSAGKLNAITDTNDVLMAMNNAYNGRTADNNNNNSIKYQHDKFTDNNLCQSSNHKAYHHKFAAERGLTPDQFAQQDGYRGRTTVDGTRKLRCWHVLDTNAPVRSKGFGKGGGIFKPQQQLKPWNQQQQQQTPPPILKKDGNAKPWINNNSGNTKPWINNNIGNTKPWGNKN
tara:strand:- start:1023 stop:2417 length:1395 start_codon:yes stop_codon:yes gene_type:complete